jgi:uracil-DNA glycosylase
VAGTVGKDAAALAAPRRGDVLRALLLRVGDRCHPGPRLGGRGDRRATRTEEALCAAWLERELRLIRPALVVTVGLVPAARLLGARTLRETVGKSFLLDDAVAVPLPHPSGASGWSSDPLNRARLGKALTHVRRELSRLDVA